MFWDPTPHMQMKHLKLDVRFFRDSCEVLCALAKLVPDVQAVTYSESSSFLLLKKSFIIIAAAAEVIQCANGNLELCINGQ